MTTHRTSRLSAGVARHRGMATITALTLLVLVGAALAVMASRVGRGVYRAESAAVESQLRQMVMAGDEAAPDFAKQVMTGGGEAVMLSRSVELPDELARRGAHVFLRQEPGEKSEVRIVVEARMSGRSLSQLLRYSTADGAAGLTDVQMR